MSPLLLYMLLEKISLGFAMNSLADLTSSIAMICKEYLYFKASIQKIFPADAIVVYIAKLYYSHI